MKNEISQTEENIKRIEGFIKYLKTNFNDHKKLAKNSNRLDEIENSIAFLKDYNEVSEKLIKVIEDYDIKMAGEVIH